MQNTSPAKTNPATSASGTTAVSVPLPHNLRPLTATHWNAAWNLATTALQYTLLYSLNGVTDAEAREALHLDAERVPFSAETPTPIYLLLLHVDALIDTDASAENGAPEGDGAKTPPPTDYAGMPREFLARCRMLIERAEAAITYLGDHAPAGAAAEIATEIATGASAETLALALTIDTLVVGEARQLRREWNNLEEGGIPPGRRTPVALALRNAIRAYGENLGDAAKSMAFLDDPLPNVQDDGAQLTCDGDFVADLTPELAALSAWWDEQGGDEPPVPLPLTVTLEVRREPLGIL